MVSSTGCRICSSSWQTLTVSGEPRGWWASSCANASAQRPRGWCNLGSCKHHDAQHLHVNRHNLGCAAVAAAAFLCTSACQWLALAHHTCHSSARGVRVGCGIIGLCGLMIHMAKVCSQPMSAALSAHCLQKQVQAADPLEPYTAPAPGSTQQPAP